MPAYTSLLRSVLQPATPSADLVAYGRHFTQPSSLPSVASRRALTLFVLALCAASGMEGAPTPGAGAEGKQDLEVMQLGEAAFSGETGQEKRREVVEGVLQGGTATWCDEQVSLRRS